MIYILKWTIEKRRKIVHVQGTNDGYFHIMVSINVQTFGC